MLSRSASVSFSLRPRERYRSLLVELTVCVTVRDSVHYLAPSSTNWKESRASSLWWSIYFTPGNCILVSAISVIKSKETDISCSVSNRNVFLVSALVRFAYSISFNSEIYLCTSSSSQCVAWVSASSCTCTYYHRLLNHHLATSAGAYRRSRDKHF